MKKSVMSLVLAVVATAAFAAPPKLAVSAVVPPGASMTERLRADATVWLLAETISSEITRAERAPAGVSAKCAKERGAAYYSCVYMESGFHGNRHEAGRTIPAGVDALLVAIFDPSAQTGFSEGTYYLLTRNGAWRSSAFRISQVPDGRLLIRSAIPTLASELGLDVPPPTTVTVQGANNSTWFGDAVVETPAELK